MENTTKQKVLQSIGNVYKAAKKFKLKDYLFRKIKTTLFRIELKILIKSKKKEIKNHNFETAATLRDQEKALLKKIDKLRSQQNKP